MKKFMTKTMANRASSSQAPLLSSPSGAFFPGMIRGVILFLAAGLAVTRLAAAEPTVNVSVYEGNVLCIRPIYLADSLPDEVRSLQPTNRIVGTVLDLRFAKGEETTVDAALKLFGSKKIPLAILVNGQTVGGAAELATRLRAANAGIIIGSTNAPGTISAGHRGGCKPGGGTQVSDESVRGAGNERPGFAGSQADLLQFVDHMSEAELVQRKIKDGEDDESSDLSPRVAPAQPVIRDPALARAVDLLKALAILKPSRG